MTNEIFDGSDVILYLLGEGQGVADEARQALPQGIIEPFDVVGFPGFLRDRCVALGRDDTLIHVILIRVKRGVCLIDLGYLTPQGFGTFAATVVDVKRNNLARRGVHGQPAPLLVGLLLHEALHVVGFSLEFVNQYVGWTQGESYM